MKIVKVGSTKISGHPIPPELTKAQKRQKRGIAKKMAERSSFTPVKLEKPTNARLKKRAQSMRRKPTPAEKRMIERLIESQVPHRTQAVIGWYIADILIEKRLLIIELDGQHHYTDEGSLSDFRRTKWLESFGFTVLRCENSKVEEFNLNQCHDYTIKSVKECDVGIKAANKERNRALYHKPCQQERYKAKRKTTKWQNVPQIDDRGRIRK